MKSTFLSLSLLLSGSLFAQNVQHEQLTPLAPMAQPTVCLTNGHFTNACPSGDFCEEWTGECSSGWLRSHGSPTMSPYSVNGQTQYQVYMWSDFDSQNEVYGEGMYTFYPFQSGRTYTVRLDISTIGSSGKVRIYAANGLQISGTTSCGENIPDGIDKLFIGEFNGLTSQSFLEFTFTNYSGNYYSQLWIYPEADVPGTATASQYELFVRSVDVCPYCDPNTIIFNNGVVPAGITEKGFIYAGSTAGGGGSGTVTVNDWANTEFNAAYEINLLPEFEANVSSGSFTASVYPCGTIGARITAGRGDISLVPAKDLQMLKAAADVKDLNVYPTVSTGLVSISGDPKLLEKAEVKVLDLSGRVVMTIPSRTNAGLKTLNLGSLNNGVYLIQIKQKENSITKKIIIQK